MALEGAYAFDDVGSTTVLDLSGNARHIDLTATNGAQVDSLGVLDDGALGKTGVNTISLPAALRTATETDDRTLMFDGVGGRAVWWVRWESVSLNTGVWGLLSLDAANIITRARDQANGNPTPAGSTVGALGAARHNFAITYVRSTGVVTYYYDGASVGTQAFAPGTALYVGADDLNVAEWSSTGAALDNLRFFSHALNDAEVAALAGTPVTASGTEVLGTAVAALGGLTATSSGVRAVGGTAEAPLGGLTATGSGVRAVTGTATSTLGGLTATAVGTGTVVGTLTANLGSVTATVVATRATFGTAVANLGGLTATAVVPGALPSTRLRVSGREPYRRVSGREPRRSI